MQWLVDNWLWVAGGVIILVLLFYLFGRPQRKKLTREQEAKAVAMILSKLTDAFEEVVDDVVGRNYTREDRKKIAMGMIAVMASDKISLDQISKDKRLFATVMAKSIAALTAMGEITAR